MKKNILVNVDINHIRIAMMEENKLVEYYEESEECSRVVGNIYKGRVRNILPGMQSAFVDVGLDKDVFVHISDIYFEEDYDNNAFEKIENETDENGKEITLIEKGILIENLLVKGQEIVIQIYKESIGNKGPRGTSLITLPGRYLVLMPNQKHVGVSRRIQNEDERERLKEIGLKLCPEGMGLILRTVADGKTEEQFEQDVKFLVKLWNKIEKKIADCRGTCLVYSDIEPVLKMVRDLLSDNVDKVFIDSRKEYEKIMDFFEFLPGDILKKIEFFKHDAAIFEYYGIEKEIGRLLNKNVALKCGGYIVIEKTEALTAIDVNTGSYVGKSSNLEDTVYITNLEASREIARQLRLRDIGGIIIVDFIDMREEEHKLQVVEELRKECEKDRMPITICEISQFGLVEMTRKRVRKSLLGQTTSPCPYCKGKGYVLSAQEISTKVRREIKKHSRKCQKDNVLVTVHPEVAFYLIGEDEKNLHSMECETSKKIYIRTEKEFHIENFIIS